MRKLLLASTAIATLVITGPAFAQEKNQAKDQKSGDLSRCQAQLEQTRERLQKDEKFTAWYRENPDGRSAYIELIQAARVFARHDMDEQCMQVVKGMDELSQKHLAATQQDQLKDRQQAERDRNRDQKDDAKTRVQEDERQAKPGDRAARMEPDPKRAERDRKPSDADRAQAQRDEQRMEQLKAAKPLEQVQVSAEELTGADVRNLQNEDLGDVEDLLMENGQILAVIVARGGFLGIGESHYKLEAKEVKVVEGEKVVVVIDVTEESLKQMAKVKKEKGRWIAASEEREPREREAQPAKRGDDARQPDENKQPAKKPQTQEKQQ